MAEDSKIHMPGSFGGLVRYDDEYESKFMLTPIHVLVFVVLIIVFTFVLKFFLG
jgi:preprotein translocase subunit Sec61beta